jgi:signal transduction histidine kinase
MTNALDDDIAAIQAISTMPKILETVAAVTGLRFVCVARVTAEKWVACAVLDKLGFGMAVGEGLDISTTLCQQVRDTEKAIVIDNVAEDPTYRDHYTPKIYGFQSYISIPIFRPDGEYFGTLCGMDSIQTNLSSPTTLSSLTLFATLISLQLQTESNLADVNKALLIERETAEFREQFIAVLGHDLRTPLCSISSGTDLLMRMPEIGPKAGSIVQRMQRSVKRIRSLIDDVVDFTRGRIGGGIALDVRDHISVGAILEQVVAELELNHPERKIVAHIPADLSVRCDGGRVGQLMSNLLNNALIHGDPDQPVDVIADCRNGIFTLAVANSGPKIPESTICQLFKPFWRASPGISNQGLGLGLFIVSEIAHSHGGHIKVVSTAEKTTFVFMLQTPEFVERRHAFFPLPSVSAERRQVCW